MFLEWDGFEIDGSDTDFDIVLPEIRQLQEFIECFLEIPLFQDQAAEFYYYTAQSGYSQKTLTKESAMQMLLTQTRPELYINVNCMVMDELSQEVQSQLYALSKLRTPPEKAFGKVQNPCMAPYKQNNYERGEMTVSLLVMKAGTKKDWYTEEGNMPEGYLYHVELMCSDEEMPCLSLNVGPGFYFEYAIFIINWLRDHFPGIGIAGGLDCAGGWTDGCTYSASIYQYELIRMPVKYSINNTLKRLAEYDLLRSFHKYYKNGWKFETNNDIQLTDHTTLNFPDYVRHVEKVLEQQENYFTSICKTAVHILLPKPECFASKPELAERLAVYLKDIDKQMIDWYCQAYIAFAKVDGQAVCEFRIPWQLREYFLELMNIVESGEADFIKKINYERRMQDKQI